MPVSFLSPLVDTETQLIKHVLYLMQEAFMKELKNTLTLLSSEDVSTCPSKELRDISQRCKIASEVNAAILTSQCREKGNWLIWLDMRK